MDLLKYDQLITDLEDLYAVIDHSDEWFGGEESEETKYRAAVSEALKVLRGLNQ